jgi:hypothetical protein
MAGTKPSVTSKQRLTKNESFFWALVAHVCNPSYLGGSRFVANPGK